jgi:hypothetical protein
MHHGPLNLAASGNGAIPLLFHDGCTRRVAPGQVRSLWHSHAMQKLRSIHLYLGCIFAPLLLFFAISGIWQTLGFHSTFLQKLSSIHTQARWKDGSELGGFPLRVFVIVMASSFILTTILGVIMAIKFGRNRKAAFYRLALGLVIPAMLVLFRMLGPHHSRIIEHGGAI